MIAAITMMVRSLAGSEGWNSRMPPIASHEVAPFALVPKPGIRGDRMSSASMSNSGPIQPWNLR